MNKKIKLLSSTLCGVIVGSGLLLTNVQAATINSQSSDKQSGISVRSIIANDVYVPYYTVNRDTYQAIYNYLKNTTSPTTTGLRDTLVSNGVPKTIANNISNSLYSLGTECQKRPFPESTGGDGLMILQPNTLQGSFNVASQDSRYTVNSYSTYAVLTPDDVKVIRRYFDSNQPLSPSKLTQYLIDNNVTTDQTAAKNIANAALTLDSFSWGDLDIGKNLLVLKADNPSNCYKIARLPR